MAAKLFLFTILAPIFFLSPDGLAQTAELGPYRPAAISNVGVSRLERLLALAELIQTRKPLYDFLNSQLADVLAVPADYRLAPATPVKARALTTDQIVYLLHNFPDAIEMLSDYADKVTVANFNEPDTVKYRGEMKKRFDEWFANNQTRHDIMVMNNPSEPLLLNPTSGPGLTKIETFVNHPILKDPEDSGKGSLPADDLQLEIVKFIDSAKKSVMINIYEFDLMSIAEALARAKARGVRVAIGIDKNTVRHKPANENVRNLLAGLEGPDFSVTEVDPVGINHQKIVVRDAGLKEGAVLFSSGNFTQSCIGKEGDLVDLPEGVRPARSLPNANHLIIVHSPLVSVVTKYELRKTLILKLRGAQYPLSGSFILKGKPDAITGKDDFVMLAFSPNGGMGNVNRDVLQRAILRSKGPIWDMAFAFSSPEVTDAIKTRARNDVAAGEKFDLKTMGDTAFAMRPWSGFLNLSGLTYDPNLSRYVERTGEDNLSEILGRNAFEKIQKQIRVNPWVFGEFTETIDGKPYQFSVKLHHKSMGFPALNWAFMGKSFNDSVSAETNQEQILLVGQREATRKLWAGFGYLYSKAPQSVAAYAEYRNRKGIKPVDRVGGANARDVDDLVITAKDMKSGRAQPLKPGLCSRVFDL